LNNPTVLVENMHLAAKGDQKNLNSLHCFVQKELLEVFVLDAEKNDGHNRVGLCCVYCGCLPKEQRDGVSMSSFFPKSVEDLYRAVCTWQRIHFKACGHIPEDMKETYWRLKDTDRTRGKKAHWVSSAKAMGFRNVDKGRSGMVWCPTIDGNGDSSQDGKNGAIVEVSQPVNAMGLHNVGNDRSNMVWCPTIDGNGEWQEWCHSGGVTACKCHGIAQCR
jgi:hypothetical protein